MHIKKYFGTDGVRSRVGDEIINPATMTKLGWAIGSILKITSKIPHILIGRDTRESGIELQNALQQGLLSAGVSVSLLGVISTPAAAYFTKKLNADAGVMITASHNLYHDNGVKVISQNGAKFSDEWEAAVEKKMQEEFSLVSDMTNHVETIDHAVSDYIEHCLDLFRALHLKNKKIIIDCANGATSAFAKNIFSQLAAHVIAIHDTPNGKNINDHCGATHLKDLQSRVIAEKADCGIALDGDGDRLMMIDHEGEIIDGDEMVCMLATGSTKKYDTVVGTLMSNAGLEKALEAHSIQFERVAVGDRYVLEKLQKNNWILGGEGSGHIINLEYASTGDGILTALQVLQVLQNTKKTLHDAKNVMQKCPQILINVSVKNPNRFSSMPEIAEATYLAEKKLNGSGRILLRASGTESCVRVMVECDEAKEANEIANSLAEVVQTSFSYK